jgi:hypothetical protein
VDSAAVGQATPDSTVIVPVASDSSVVLRVPAGAAAAAAESTVVSQSTGTRPGTAVRTRKARHVEPSYRVVLRSLVYPGWGQLHNGKSLKALAVFVSEGALLGMIYTEARAASRAYDKHLAESDVERAAELYSEYEKHFERQESFTWWTVGLVLFSLADAYVDANLVTFEDEFRDTGQGAAGAGGAGGDGADATGGHWDKVSVSFQSDQSCAGGFVCLSYAF